MLSRQKQKFYDFLKTKNLNLTEQRQVILDLFLKSNSHLSLEDFAQIVKKKDSTIGFTTVFRMLKLLKESGLAETINLGDKITRYELKIGKEHHDHLICEKCGSSIEFSDAKIEKLQLEICKKYDFKMKKHSLKIFGICKNCQSNH